MLKPRLLLILFLLFCSELIIAQVKISSWNLQNFGKTKSESEINFVADVLNEFDVVALQEVVAGLVGVQTVATLACDLNRQGTRVDYL